MEAHRGHPEISRHLDNREEHAKDGVDDRDGGEEEEDEDATAEDKGKEEEKKEEGQQEGGDVDDREAGQQIEREIEDRQDVTPTADVNNALSLAASGATTAISDWPDQRKHLLSEQDAETYVIRSLKSAILDTARAQITNEYFRLAKNQAKLRVALRKSMELAASLSSSFALREAELEDWKRQNATVQEQLHSRIRELESIEKSVGKQLTESLAKEVQALSRCESLERQNLELQRRLDSKEKEISIVVASNTSAEEKRAELASELKRVKESMENTYAKDQVAAMLHAADERANGLGATARITQEKLVLKTAEAKEMRERAVQLQLQVQEKDQRMRRFHSWSKWTYILVS